MQHLYVHTHNLATGQLTATRNGENSPRSDPVARVEIGGFACARG